MSLEIIGKIKTILEVQEGMTKNNLEWKKIGFVTSDTYEHNGETKENINYFEVFGVQNVDNFIQYNNVGDNVKVSFRNRANEHKGKYYVTPTAWRVEKITENTQKSNFEPAPNLSIDKQDDLPF